jgi:hypothetical protein
MDYKVLKTKCKDVGFNELDYGYYYHGIFINPKWLKNYELHKKDIANELKVDINMIDIFCEQLTKEKFELFIDYLKSESLI